MLAVWAVLSENWPSAFKRVDVTDPAGVWAANIDDLSSRQINAGLLALGRYDDRYMPNAPTCRKIILEAAGVQRPTSSVPEIEYDPVERQFNALCGRTWMNWVLFMSSRGVDVLDYQAEACRAGAYAAVRELREAYRNDNDKGLANSRGFVVAVTAALLKLFNKECVIPEDKQIHTWEQLYGEEEG